MPDNAIATRELVLEASQCEDEGCVYELSLHNRKLRAMLGLARCVRLRVLDLSFNSICMIEGLEALGDLRELKLYGNAITHVGGLEGVLKLQTLLLHDNRLCPSCAVGSALANLSNLATLRLDRNSLLGSEGLQQLKLAQLPALTELNASSLQLQSVEALIGLRQLATLELAHNQLSSLGSLAQLTALQVRPPGSAPPPPPTALRVSESRLSLLQRALPSTPSPPGAVPGVQRARGRCPRCPAQAVCPFDPSA